MRPATINYGVGMHRGGAIKGRGLTVVPDVISSDSAREDLVSADTFLAECRLIAGDDDGAVTLAEQALGRARALGCMHSATPLLHRIRGEALIALGRRADGLRALRRSLDAARHRHADDEVAFTLTAMLRAGAPGTAYQRAEWRRERDLLTVQLDLPR